MGLSAGAPREHLSASSIGAFLVEHGLASSADEVIARELTGGISNVVLAVDVGSLRAVVKQSLPKLRVADDWPAKRERTVTEGEALRLAGELYPGAVPRVIALIPESYVLVIERAPDDWSNFKDVLLRSEPLNWVAERCGHALGVWHARTWEEKTTKARFGDTEAFAQLRIDPYHRTTASRLPQFAGEIARYAEQLLRNQKCLVHGDFSPKNVLFGTRDLWVVDWEVAHFGDPVFDLAFMLNHLLLKSIHRPEIAEGCRLSAQAFIEAYSRSIEPPDLGYVLGQASCLMLARVDGKSPAEYLSEHGRFRAREVGGSMLKDPPNSLAAAWELVAA